MCQPINSLLINSDIFLILQPESTIKPKQLNLRIFLPLEESSAQALLLIASDFLDRLASLVPLFSATLNVGLRPQTSSIGTYVAKPVARSGSFLFRHNSEIVIKESQQLDAL